MTETGYITDPGLLQEARLLVERLHPHRMSFNANACGFVGQMNAKFRQYGNETFVSDEQLNWLRILEKQLPDERQQSLF
jgi:hypothetical protein